MLHSYNPQDLSFGWTNSSFIAFVRTGVKFTVLATPFLVP